MAPSSGAIFLCDQRFHRVMRHGGHFAGSEPKQRADDFTERRREPIALMTTRNNRSPSG